MEILEKELTGKINELPRPSVGVSKTRGGELTLVPLCGIKAFYNVYNRLGYGFLEKVYERSMNIELKKFGLKCES